MNMWTKPARRDDELKWVITRRTSAESDLGHAADALERAATTIQRLALDGITYMTTEEGDMLGRIRQLSDRVLAMQVQVRTENHQ